MRDVEQEPLHATTQGENRFTITAITSLVLATGSLLLWRLAAKFTSDRSDPNSQDKPSLFHAALSSLHLVEAPPTAKSEMDNDRSLKEPSVSTSDYPGDAAGRSKPASSRSKERRRRGKDPIKQLAKGGKRAKSLLKNVVHVAGDQDNSDNDAASGHSSQLFVEPQDLRESRNSSVAGSSRSSSLAANRISNADEPRPETTPETGPSVPADDTEGKVLDVPAAALGQSASTPEFNDKYDAELEVQHPTALRTTRSEFTSLREANAPATDTGKIPHSVSSSKSGPGSASDIDSHSGSNSVLTGNTSPTLSSLTDKSNLTDAPHLYASQSMPPYISGYSPISPTGYPENRRTSASSHQSSGTWDWDGQSSSSSAANDKTYQKPPRFRSKSRVSGSGAGSPMSGSMSYTIPFSPISPTSFTTLSVIPPVPSSTSVGQVATEEGSSFAYPSLNPSPISSPPPNHHLAVSNFHTVTTPHSTPYRAPTPSRGSRRTPTPSHAQELPGGSSVSTQTQIASLRGALEAARMREEKSRQDAEKMTRECEMLKWRWAEDVAAWRRKEIELQSQIHYLLHQFQAYSALSTAIQSSASTSHLHLANHFYPSHINSHAYPIPASSSSSPQSPPSQSHTPANMPAYPNQVPSSPSASSQFSGAAPQNLFSLFFPGAPTPSPSVPSSGSMSPVIDFSPLHHRGRRRTREDGWVVGEDAGGVSEATDGVEDQEVRERGEGEFNDVLADAIFKRPESLRSRSDTKKSSAGKEKRKDEEQPLTVFTFPSLSNIGNVERGYDYREKDEENEPMTVTAAQSAEGIDSDDKTLANVHVTAEGNDSQYIHDADRQPAG